MPTIQIKNRWTNAVIWEDDAVSLMDAVLKAKAADANLCDADLRDANLRDANLRRANLRGANLRRADLRRADLRRADLRGADLRRANLRRANLCGADLRDADLRGANLRDADLRDANLCGANLRDADLRGANLRDANLQPFKNDLFEILLHAPVEVDGLKKALLAGKVDGSTYTGDCCCLVGTVAKERGVEVDKLPGIKPDSSRPAERWFMGIKKGHTPKNSQIAKLTLEWIEEFQSLIGNAVKALA